MSLDPKIVSSAREGLEEFVDERTETFGFEDGSSLDGMMQVAQVNTGGFQVQNAQDGDFDPDAVTQSFTAAAGLVVPLPAGTVIDRILVSGNDLVIITTGGSVYLVENGANIPPAIQIGDLTIPSEQIATALSEVPDIQTAAGPQGGPGSGSSGNNFSQFDIEDLGDGFDVGDLLQGLGLFFAGGPGGGTTEDPPIEPVEPIIVDGGPEPVSAVLLEEDDLLGVFSAFFGGFGGFEGFEGGNGVPGGPPAQYDPFFVIAGFGELLYDLEYGFEYLYYEDGFYLEDIFFPGFIGNLGGTILFNTDLSFLEIFGGLGNDEDGSRPDGLWATGSFNLGFANSDTEFDRAAIDLLNTGLTSNGEPVLFQISEDGKTLYAYTVEQLESFYGGPLPGELLDLILEELGIGIEVFFGEEKGLPIGIEPEEIPLVRPIFEININDGDGAYTVHLYNNLDHLPTVQGEEILPYNFPFISTNLDDSSTVTGFFQAQFQDDVPVLVKDVLESLYDALVEFANVEEPDLSQFGWGFDELSEFLSFIAGDDPSDIDPSVLGTFEELYAFLQVIVGLEYGAVSEKFLDTIDIETYPDLVFNHGTFDADDIIGSLGTHADGYDYFNPYTEFFEYLFSHDHYDHGEGGDDDGGHDHDDCPDGSVTTYGLLGALFGADYGEARTIVFNEAMAGAATVGGDPLQSKGEDVTYVISEDGTLLQAFASSGDDDEPRLVFEVELTDQITGAFRFTLFDQLDHAAPGPEQEGSDNDPIGLANFGEGSNDLFDEIADHVQDIIGSGDGIQDGIGDDFAILEFLYDAIDSDGDVATGSFFVEVWDDEPYYANGYFGNMLADEGILAHEAGQDLVGRLFVGADEPGSIAFNFTQDDLDGGSETLEELGLPETHNGFELSYALSDGDRTLTATYAGTSAVVFILTLDPSNLTYSFELVLNSPPFNDDDNNEFARTLSPGFQTLNIDVAITGTDFDGDPLYSSERISIRTSHGDYYDNGLYEGVFSEGVFFEGTEYNDSIVGSSHTDTYVYAGYGNDLIVAGGAQYNHFHGEEGDDILIGGDNVDDLYGDDGNDLIIGGDGNDNLYGGDGKDILRGGRGYDELYGGKDSDLLIGNRGNDVLRGGRGDDELRGGRGDDELRGGRGDDDLRGGRGEDDLRGGRGDDDLRGGRGDDDLRGGRGDDFMDGGAGDDRAIYDGNSADYEIGVATDDDGNVIGLTVTDLVGNDGTDTLVDIESIRFKGDNQTFDLTDPVLLLDDNGALVATFTTIQDAVDNALADYTVLVAPGTYNENVVIDESIRLLSIGGRDVTIIDGVQAGSELGAIEIDPGVNDVTIGDIGQGFTIRGINGNGAVEKAAIYIQGDQNNLTIRGNDLVARGDSAITSEFAAAVTNVLIAYNIISGQTFEGANPSGIGFTTQGDLGNNAPRQLVVMGNGDTATPTSNNITFTNNEVTGTAGGISTDDGVTPQGNTLVTIDAADSVISDNTFSGFTARFATAIRARGPNTDVEDNTLDHTGGGDSRGIFIKNQGTPGDYDGNVLNGGPGDEVIFSMTPGDDTLNGNGGDDVLVGDAGEDTLNGGAGNNILAGGADADLFVFDSDALDGLLDEVLDYDLTEGDQVDLTALFDVAGGDIADFVSYDDTSGELTVDADGVGGNAGEVIATFTGNPVDVEVLFTDSSTPGDDSTVL